MGRPMVNQTQEQVLTRTEWRTVHLCVMGCMMCTALVANLMAWLPEIVIRSLFIGAIGLISSHSLRKATISRRVLNGLTVLATLIVFLADVNTVGWQAGTTSMGNTTRLIMGGIMTLLAFRCFTVFDANDAALTLMPGISVFILCHLPVQGQGPPSTPLYLLFFTPFSIMGLVLLIFANTERLRGQTQFLTPPEELTNHSRRLLPKTILGMSLLVIICSVTLSVLLTSFLRTPIWFENIQRRAAEWLASMIVPHGSSIDGLPRPLSLRGNAFPSSDNIILRVDSRIPGYWRMQSFDKYSNSHWYYRLQKSNVIPGQSGDVPSSDVVPDSVGRLGVTQVFHVERPIIGGLPVLFEATNVELDEEGVQLLVDEGSNIRCQKPLVKNTSYTVHSRIKQATPEQLNSTATPPLDQSLQRYLDVPPDLGRLRAKAYAITNSSQSPWTKVLALKKHLESPDFIYSTTPARAPVYQDQVEFFIFESKEGYCTHYASALTLMCRSIGIPARMVTGYATGQFDDRSLLFVVRERDAHAWTEIYLPTVGWIATDASPSTVPAPILMELAPTKISSWETLWNNFSLSIRHWFRKWQWYLFTAITLTITAGVLIRNQLSRRRLSQIGPLHKVSDLQRLHTVVTFRKASRWMNRHFRRRRSNETMIEYSHACSPNYDDGSLAPFVHLAQLTSRSLYSNQHTDPDEDLLAKELLNDIKRAGRIKQRN